MCDFTTAGAGDGLMSGSASSSGVALTHGYASASIIVALRFGGNDE